MNSNMQCNHTQPMALSIHCHHQRTRDDKGEMYEECREWFTVESYRVPSISYLCSHAQTCP